MREAWHVVEPSQRYIHGWHIDAICDHLEAVTDGQIIRLLINIPPGTMKSLLVSVLWPAWEWGPRGLAGMRYLTTSYAEKYVKRDSRRMRDLVSSQWYRALWPEITLTRAGEMSFANTQTGFREGVPFASMTAGRGDRVIIDDPHSTETAESATERENTARIFRESVTTRLNDPEKSAIVVVMQRLHADDVSGQILKLGLGYDHLMLPMEFEPARACRTSIGFVDPRTFEGELLFPERFPRTVIERDKVPMGSYAVAGQFQQRPAPRSGGLFKREWFAEAFVGAVPSRVKRVRAWDLASTAKKAGNKPDWTAGVLVAREQATGLFFVEGMLRFQQTAGIVAATIKTTAAIDKVSTRVRIPKDPGQAGVAQAETMILMLAGYDAVAVAPTGDKETRATPASVQCEAHNVKIVQTGDPARDAWIEPFIDELCGFPTGSNDDQVDAFADAVNELALGSRYTLDNV